MVPTATYDEIADWYEQEFLGRQQASGRQRRRRPTGYRPYCVTSSAMARVPAWSLAAVPACAPPASETWAGPRSASTCPPGCYGTPGAASPWHGPMPSGCRSATVSVPAVIAVMVHTDMPAYPAVLR